MLTKAWQTIGISLKMELFFSGNSLIYFVRENSIFEIYIKYRPERTFFGSVQFL
jgi:hypothetical protein